MTPETGFVHFAVRMNGVVEDSQLMAARHFAGWLFKEGHWLKYKPGAKFLQNIIYIFKVQQLLHLLI
ncbi:MAG: hypothetical protein Q8R91_02035 [Candidatus Omnitrophota bacterium]|nr:hypothetical protein [Candidatus Omnitrophota bacterium]